jgi:succinoglycan biosynthesis transport protein ExoP
MNQLFGQPADPMRSSDPDLGLAPPPARPLPVGGAEQAFFHLDIRRSLELNWRLALKIASAGVIFAVLYFLAQALWLKTWPSYESSSLVYVQPTPPRVLENNGAAPRWPYDTNTYETYILQQMMNVTRDDVLAAAVKKLPQFAGAHQSTQAAAQHLAALLSVDRQNSAYQFTISARAGTAQMAADIANAVTAAYMESATRDQRTGDAERMGMLRDERDRIQAALDADRTEQSTLNRQLGVASVNNTPDHYDEDIASTRTELVKARVDHDAAEAKFTALGAGKGPSSATIDAMADEMASSDAGLVSMKTALNGRRATLISQMANLTPGNPVYKQDEAELEKINADLESMMKNLRATAAARVQLQLKAELERTAGVESKVNGQLRQLVGAAGSATPKMQRSSDLAADITRLQARFSTVDEQLHNMMLEDNAPAAAYQVTPAEPPLSRTKSGVVRNSFLIAFAGIALGLLVAILVHKLDPRVRIAQDVELILGFPPMAQLPDFTEVSEGAADEFLLRLSSSIEHARKQSNLRSCVFTGAGPGVGVTMLVNRVGEMLDAMGRPTVRVDATGAAAHHRTARPEASASDAAVSASASATSIPGLVQADRYARPTAIFQQIAEETETQDDNLVLTDTMPLSVSAETEYLVRFVDCAIVVIESGKTTRRELRDAAATLQRLDVAAVGFVLNRVGLAKADPAFRSSIQAIEKHLRGQAGASARRSQRGKQPYVPEPDLVAEARPVFTSDAKPVFVSEAKPVSVAEPSVAQSHEARVEDDAPVVAAHVPSRYEPELASVAAAVARLSHPAVAPASAPAAAAPEHVEEAPASLPSPTVPSSAVEVAATPEPARRFSFADLFKPAASVPAPGAKTVSTEPTVEPARTLIPDSALSSVIKAAPFAEAARKLAASPTPELHAFRPSSSVARPFADVSDHFKSALFDSALFAPPVAPEVSADSAAESSAPVPGSAPSEPAPAEAALVEHQAASSSSLDRARAEDAHVEPAPADFATIPADVSVSEPAELSHAEYAAQAPPEQNVDPMVTPEASSLPTPAAADPWSAWIAGQTSAAAPIAPIHVPEVPVAQVDAPWWKSVATERSPTEELPVSTADTARLVTPQHGEAVESATALPGHEVSKHAPSALEATMESLNLHKHETESVHADDFDEFAAALTPLDAAASGPIPTAESSAAAPASVSDAAVLPPLSAAKELAEDDPSLSLLSLPRPKLSRHRRLSSPWSKTCRRSPPSPRRSQPLSG